MRAFFQNRLLIVFLFAAFALSGCDLFNSDDEQTPTSPLAANVVQQGQVTVQAGATGVAEYLGQVVNTGNVTASNVVVSANIFNGAGGLIDVASTSSVPASLGASETGTFKITSTTPLAQAITFQIVIEWD